MPKHRTFVITQQILLAHCPEKSMYWEQQVLQQTKSLMLTRPAKQWMGGISQICFPKNLEARVFKGTLVGKRLGNRKNWLAVDEMTGLFKMFKLSSSSWIISWEGGLRTRCCPFVYKMLNLKNTSKTSSLGVTIVMLSTGIVGEVINLVIASYMTQTGKQLIEKQAEQWQVIV